MSNTSPPHPTPSMILDGLTQAGVYIPSDKLGQALEIARGKAQEQHERLEAIRRKYREEMA